MISVYACAGFSDLPDIDGGIIDGSAATVLLLGVTRIPTTPTPERHLLPPQQVACTRPPSTNHQLRYNGHRQIEPPTPSPWKLGYTRLDDVCSARPYCCCAASSTVVARDTGAEVSARDAGAEVSALSVRAGRVIDRSVDSIGNCSLDADDASSAGNLYVAADSCEKSSVDTLRSVSLPTPPSAGTFRAGAAASHNHNIRLPSYLSLACTVNGYSTTTNYNPDRRLLRHSNDQSPHHPADLTSPPNIIPPPINTMNNITAYIDTDNSTTSFFANSADESNGYTKQLISDNKSFIQQRVERLYGPGALAQGFFVTKRSPNRNFNECFGANVNCAMRQSASSPALPVLRHLRPEFRAQLPTLSPRKMGGVINTAHAQHRGLKDSIVQDGVVLEIRRNGVDWGNNADLTNNVVGDRSDRTNVHDDDDARAATVIKDGQYFLQVMQREADRLAALATQAEELLAAEEAANLSEDATGLIRSTSGKARLLVSKKMQQFRGLCANNIARNVDETFPTTNEDLQGFWDMVMLQVNQVDQLFLNLNKLKANNWVEDTVIVCKPLGSAPGRKIINRRPIGSTANSGVADEARKQRELQRKRIIDERRKAIREQKLQQNARPQETVEFFVPDNC